MHRFTNLRHIALASAGAVLLAGMVLMAGCSSILPQEEAALDIPLVTPAPVEYKTEPAKVGSISNEVTLTGQIIAESEQNLYFTAEQGRLTEVLVNTGDAVKEGDILATVGTDELDRQIKMQKLEVERAQILYDEASKAVDNTDLNTQIEVQVREVNKAQIAYDSAPEGTEKNMAALTLEQMRIQLDAMVAKRDHPAASSAASLAAVTLEEQKLTLEALKDQKEGTEITAPFDGVITYTSKTKIGDSVAGYETIVTICDPATLIAASDDQETTELSVGAVAQVVLSDKSVLNAEVIETPATIDDKSEYAGFSFLKFTDPLPEKIKSGAKITIKYKTEEKDNVIVIPKKFVVSASDRKYVVVLENGLRVEKDVTIGISNTTDVEIKTGLSEGDLIITN